MTVSNSTNKSLPAYADLLSGRRQNVNNNYYMGILENLEHPTIVDEMLAQGYKRSDAAFFASWSAIKYVVSQKKENSYPIFDGGWSLGDEIPPWILAYGWSRFDHQTVSRVLYYIQNPINSPAFLFTA